MSGALWDTKWITIDAIGTKGDWAVSDPTVETSNQGGLQSRDELGTAVLLALFTEGRIPDYLLDQFGFQQSDQTQWHGNMFNIEEGEEELGSFLHIINRAPLTLQTAKLAEHFAAEALQVLIRNRWLTGVEVTSEMIKVNEGSAPAGLLRLTIRTFGKEDRIFIADLFPLQ